MTDIVIRAVLEIADFMIAQKRIDDAADKAAAAFVRMGGAQDKAAAAAAAYGARLLETSRKMMGLARAHDPVDSR